MASNGVRRFRQEIDGEVWVGLVWRSEREMELWLCDRGFPVSEALALSDADEESPRARGRPSMDALIGAAVATLRDRLTGSRSDRARTVLQELAKHASEDMLPSLKTITRYLATLEGQKSGQKSTDDKPTTDGGAQCLRKSGAK